VAAGRSERMGGKMDKAFLSLGPRPVLAYSLMAFEECVEIDEIILVVRREQLVAARGVAQMFGCSKVKEVVAGGVKRQISVSNGLNVLNEETRLVAVHDGARPCVTAEMIRMSLKAAKRYGSGVLATRITDTVKRVDKGQVVSETLDRAKVWTVQTPQTFKVDILRQAFDKLEASGETVTDESAAVEQLGEPVHLVPWHRPNLKITTAEDLPVAAALLGI
jgi:2-C-methyl-D-erythritol 4-phosphate cytidylyltransferase